MLIQGLADSLFGLDQADANASALAAAKTPLAVRWSDGGHDGASSHEVEETEAGYAWLDHYVRDRAPRDSALPTDGFVYPTAAQRRSQPANLWSLPTYPGLGGGPVPMTQLALSSTRGGLLHPPGGQPAALVAVPALASISVGLSTYQIAALPGQSTALDTAPVERTVTVVGSPSLTLTLTADTPTVTLFASLWRLNGDQPTLPNALVAPIRVPVTPGEPTTVTVSLPAATYAMPAGSRWRVLLTSTESTFSNDRTPSRILVESSARLALPTAEGTQVGAGASGGPDTETMVAGSILAALLLAAAAGALLRRHRRRLEPSRPELADVPLVVDSLVKTYADGHRAVDDVS
jgi:ABC-2 type transport system ATP-binding protein